MDPGINRHIQSTVDEAQSALFSRLDVLMSEKLGELEAKIHAKQVDISNVQRAQIRQDIIGVDNHKFTKKSCEEQFKFNRKVASKLQEADEISLHDPQATKSLIAEGMDLINHRQKLIKLADTSEAGWKAVEEYISNPLASDSDDEKRMDRARSRADRKIKAAKQKSTKWRSRYSPYQRSTYSTPAEHSGQSDKVIPVRTPRPGVCYGCGRAGHWRSECPAMSAGGPSNGQKISSIFDTKHVELNDISTVSAVRVKRAISPFGRLNKCLAYWKGTGASDSVLSVIADGYKLPFKEIPPNVRLRNNKSARDNLQFVNTEVENLLSIGCISEVKVQPRVVNPLTVAYNRAGKPRLVLDCRHINVFLHKFKFKYEDARVARDLFHQGDFLFTFDLKSAYHHIEIYPEHRNFLGFEVEMGGVGRFFVFNVLPFGISTAGYIFTKVLRQVVKHVRGQGHKLVMFLDDGIGGHGTVGGANVASQCVKRCLRDYGFLIADEKCQWEPSQDVTWLGYTWAMIEGVLRVSTDRVDRLVSLLKHTMSLVCSRGQLLFSARYIASIVGLVISMHSVIGSMVRLRTRELSASLLTRASWNAGVFLSAEALNEIEFWLSNVQTLNDKGSTLRESNKCSKVICTDASEVGYGGFVIPCVDPLMEGDETLSAEDTGYMHEALALAEGDGFIPNVERLYEHGDCVVIGTWDSDERVRSSTWRELEAAKRVLFTTIDRVRGHNVRLFMDNKGACSIARVGSGKTHLQKVAMDMHRLTSSNSVNLVTQWLPRNSNKTADFLSRCSDSDDWSVQAWVFGVCEKKWGPHEVDRFASDYNKKCTRFNSRWWCPGTEAIDAFTVFWGRVNNWLVPPPRLVCKMLDKMKADQAYGTVVVPAWRSAAFWPVLCQGDKFASFVKDYTSLSKNRVTIDGRGNNGIFEKGVLSFNMLALRLDFRH
ncbi:uncharacterized protein LOC117340457 [Pecten maximus]|uniref:uncharacterized protein LOC117340457 n=1 Tax=Pecten maximus TaxID=6579 RepID=UPI001458D589|nr:uncharacterized protein LOC117340457 [Pecten maximus]